MTHRQEGFCKNTLTIKKTTDKLNLSKDAIKRVKMQIMGREKTSATGINNGLYTECIMNTFK